MQGEKSFDTGELKLSYLEDGSGAPMVLLHGLSSQKEQWQPVIPALAAHWHIYRPDLRGHGTSGHPADGYATGDYARDIGTLLKHIGAPAVVMGHSLGALVTIAVAADYPDLTRAVILLDPPLSTWTTQIDNTVPPGNIFQVIYDLNSGAQTREEMIPRFRSMLPPGADDNAVQGMMAYMSRVAAGTVKAALDNAMWKGRDLPRDLQNIKCPVLLIHADADHGGAMPEQDIAFFKANCPSATVVRIPEADHGLHMTDQPEIALKHINEFLASV